MTSRERFIKVLNFELPDDRLPMVEWAPWWDQTLERWKVEGLPEDLYTGDVSSYFGLDRLECIDAGARDPGCPEPAFHGAPVVVDDDSYEDVRKHLFTDEVIDRVKRTAISLSEEYREGRIIVRLWLDGFFWFPRTLFGIENHLFAFYDHPDLMHRMNSELADFSIRVIEELFPILKPDMVGFAEDMSYNHGPMLSYSLFREFLMPYYQKVIPSIKRHGVKVLVDSDGDITAMIPWLLEAGIEGVYPLERQAGVDINHIREQYPEFLMMGGFDKMEMTKGEDAIRREFERLLPTMRSGGYIPSVDHQTPPGVSLDDYKTYVRLFREYAERAIGPHSKRSYPGG